MTLKSILKKASFMAMLGGSTLGLGGHQEKSSQVHYDVCEKARMEQVFQEFKQAQHSFEYAQAQSYLSSGKNGISGEYHFDNQTKTGQSVLEVNGYQRIVKENEQGRPLRFTEKFPNGEKNTYWREDGTIKLKTDVMHSERMSSDLREEYDTQGRLIHSTLSQKFPQIGRTSFSEKNFENGHLVGMKEMIEMKNGQKKTHTLSISQENDKTFVSEEFNGDIFETLYDKETKVSEVFLPQGNKDQKIERRFDSNGVGSRVPMTLEQRQARLAKYRSGNSQ